MEFICPECKTNLVKRIKQNVYYACPSWKADGSGCPGHIYFEGRDIWKIPSDTHKGLLYEVRRKEDGRLFCSCPGGSVKKNCKHRKKVRDYYETDKMTAKENNMREVFDELKKQGLFEKYKSYEDWQKGKYKIGNSKQKKS